MGERAPVIGSHAPDSPFGCRAIWGPVEASQSKDGRLHVCNKQLPHGHYHVCKCGSRKEW